MVMEETLHHHKLCNSQDFNQEISYLTVDQPGRGSDTSSSSPSLSPRESGCLQGYPDVTGATDLKIQNLKTITKLSSYTII
jgi:hypothetical protein